MRISVLFAAALAVVVRAATIQTTPAQQCQHFANGLDLSEYNTTVINSTYYATDEYVFVAGMTNNAPFCQIYAQTVYGSPGTTIWAIWLPEASAYQGRFLAVGDGGFAGEIETSSMLADFNLDLGFAVAGGDGGHSALTNDAGGGAPGVYLPFLHHQDEVLGWIHNGISIFTPPAKAITQARYNAVKYSYYDGCSTGGAQGFALAQFHPTLFQGIVASSPGNYYSHLALSFLWNDLATNTPETYIPQTQLTAMTAAVVAKCGGPDGVINDPPACQFDVDSFACNATNLSLNNTVCLSAAQVAAAKKIYAGPTDSETGAQLYPGFAFGSESSWLEQEGLLADAFSIPILQNLVYDDLSYDANGFNFSSDEVAAVNEKAGTLIDEIDPDIQQFHALGGKLLTVQGWADQLNSPFWPIEHLQQVEAAFSGNVSSWFELFMSPGTGHCGSNELYPNSPGTYATTAALVAWVEQGSPPSQIEASMPPSGANVTRKLCPYPQLAEYTGSDPDDWTSYTCEAPPSSSWKGQ